jgi:hypothetical protein
MIDIITQKAVLVGQVIEDVTYAALDPDSFRADLVGVQRTPQYKPGGFFVFSDLPPGNYTLRVSGARFQPHEYTAPIASTVLFLDRPGDNDLAVVVKTANGSGNKITFSPVVVSQPIQAGAAVVGPAAFATTLAARIEPGRAIEAKLIDSTGLAPGAIVRIVRDKAIRLRFAPYDPLPAPLTRIVGKVTLAGASDLALADVEVRMTQVNGANVVLNDIAGAPIATVEIDTNKTILGAEQDMATMTNQQGEYNLYFGQQGLFQNATLTATLAGYQAATSTLTIVERGRNRADFTLARL